MRTQIKKKNRHKAQENAGDQVVVIFVCDWLKERREFSGPITEQNKAKPVHFRIAFENQLKISLWSTKHDLHQSKLNLQIQETE